MKEKNKNILKGLGVGALACFGMFAMTGCSVELSQSQIDKVMQVVDQSDKFMEDTLELLEKQNAKLSKEEGWDLYQLAITKFLTNQDGIRNNMKISSQYMEGDEVVCYLYNDSESIDIVLQTGGELSGSRLTYVNQEDSSNYVYQYNKYGSEYEKTLLGEGATENYNPILAYVDNGYSLEDVVDCELLENGNYQLSFIQYSEVEEEIEEEEVEKIGYYNYAIYEITSEGIIVSQNTKFAEVNLSNDGTISEVFGGTIKYEYGVVQESDFAIILAVAKEAALTPEE